MSAIISAGLPVSSGEMPIPDFERVECISQRHQQLANYLRDQQLDGILIQEPANFAWLTCGGDSLRKGNSQQPTASILVTQDARVVLCNNIDSGQLFDQELSGLGFLLKERPWTEPPEVLQQDVCRGRTVAADSVVSGVDCPVVDLRVLRFELEQHEIRQMRELARELTHAVEATARNFEPGETEAEIAGQLAHRLMRHQIEPVSLQIMADAQGTRYRHWNYGDEVVERQCVLSAVGRKYGLHVGASRMISIGAPSAELRQDHSLATLVQATGMYFTRPEWTVDETWKRVARIYEKFEVPDEWRLAEQGEVVGYSASEMEIIPGSEQIWKSGMAVNWHPSVRSALVGDTILVTDSGSELLTTTQNWPVISVKVKDATLDRPGILIREVVP